MMKYVYRYTDPSRNEVIYIGQGTQGKTNGWKYKRANSHLKRTDTHPFVQRLQLMAREGVQPVIDILIEGIDKELADLIEIEAIDKYGRKDLGRGTLLNLHDGGLGGGNLAASSRARIGEFAKNRSVELKQKIAKAQSASHKGNVWWIHTSGEQCMSKTSPGDGWERGRKFDRTNAYSPRGAKWWHDDSGNTKMAKEQPGPTWKAGRK